MGKSKRPKKSTAPAAKPAAPRPVPRAARLSPGRLWLFRVVALLLPVFAVLLLELGLRVAGYGYATAFYKEMEQDGRRYVINNETFSQRFFPPELARWATSFKFAADKPPDVCRIFVFGESAAMGDPQPAYGASRYMDILLRERYPGKKFEVINLGITAINSHVILPIARETARHDGDVWILYIGNNEMVGPFGAATVFGSRAPSRAFVRLNLAIQKTRTGQLLMAGLRNLGGQPKNTSWGGMQMFLENRIAPADARKKTVYANFAANLRDIADTGLRSGTPVILSTMSVNLRDCPPFASLSDSNRPASELQGFAQVFAEAKTLQQQSNWVAAAGQFAAAIELDPVHAEAHFRLAESRLQLADAPAARESFQRACDLDALPFRADTRINAAIRELARNRAGQRLVFCDAEAALLAASPVGIAGDESFFEHVHFNFAGNYRLGKVWAEHVVAALPPEGLPTAAGDWATQETCEQRLGLTDWNRLFVIQSVIRRLNSPPLSSQFNNDARLLTMRFVEDGLKGQTTQPGAPQRAGDFINDALRRSPDDFYLYEAAANLLEATNHPDQAIAAYRELLKRLPHDFYANLQLGRLLGELGQPAAGQPFLENATRHRPSLPEGWHELGLVLAAQGKFPAALECSQRAERLRPEDPGYVCYTAKMLAKMRRRTEAIDHYRRAIQMRPDFWEARFELAGELATDDQVNDALREYAEVLRINPRHVTARINFGVVLVRVNQLEEAIQQFEEALRIEPANRAAQDYLTQVRARKAGKP